MVYGSHCCSLVERLLTVLGRLKKNSRSESNVQSYCKLLCAGLSTNSGDGEMTAETSEAQKEARTSEMYAMIFLWSVGC